MKKQILTMAIVVIAVSAITESASAQLFRRRWERRKAELHTELHDQLSGELTDKLNQDVARESKK